jgi:hypothetical protein
VCCVCVLLLSWCLRRIKLDLTLVVLWEACCSLIGFLLSWCVVVVLLSGICCVVLICLALSYQELLCVVLCCVVLCCVVLCCVVLCCVVLCRCLVLSCLVLSCLCVVLCCANDTPYPLPPHKPNPDPDTFIVMYVRGPHVRQRRVGRSCYRRW